MTASVIFGIVSMVLFIAIAAFNKGKSVFDCSKN